MNRLNIRNMTPHPITILTSEGEPCITYPPDPEGPLRVSLDFQPIPGTVIVVPVLHHFLNLPDRVTGTVLIVSLATRLSLLWRDDLVVPAGTVKGDDGAILGCRSLSTGVPITAEEIHQLGIDTYSDSLYYGSITN